jgi:hypothetical protein
LRPRVRTCPIVAMSTSVADPISEILDRAAGGNPVVLLLLLLATIVVWHVALGIGEALHLGLRAGLLRLMHLDGSGRPRPRRRRRRRPGGNA